MKLKELRQKYPKFIYEKYEYDIIGNNLVIKFHYSIPPDHNFTHILTFENLKDLSPDTINHSLIFTVGLAEATGYWKTTSSPIIEVKNNFLTKEQTLWWHELFINGFSQYFYENQIDYTVPEFLTISSFGDPLPNHSQTTLHESVLLPIGGGKDSTVTGELLKPHFPIRPIIVYPATPASSRISKMLTNQLPITVTRSFDPYLFEMNNLGYLNGHVPYSAIISTMFLLAAEIERHKYIVVSNERSSNEGNVTYLGYTVNHQYSKSSQFESDFNMYIRMLGLNIKYFSFLRPLYELQIAKLFSKMPQYFETFRSCNKGQKEDLWCGSCAKCLSIAMTLGAWTGEQTIKKIFGGENPLKNPANSQILKEMTDPNEIKPFECITTTEEANVCLELIEKGFTPRVKEFISRWDSSAMPTEFEKILKSAL